MSHSDLTFFTNEPGATLLDRFRATLKDTQLFDILVGYFRASGFYQLHESIATTRKTRILVGLGINNESFQIIDSFQSQSVLDFESHKKAKKSFQDNLVPKSRDRKVIERKKPCCIMVCEKTIQHPMGEQTRL